MNLDLDIVPNQSSIALVYGAFFRSQIDCVTTELQFFENQCFISLNYSYTLTRPQASLTSNRVAPPSIFVSRRKLNLTDFQKIAAPLLNNQSGI